MNKPLAILCAIATSILWQMVGIGGAAGGATAAFAAPIPGAKAVFASASVNAKPLVTSSTVAPAGSQGPYYLALGDSAAYGYQPDGSPPSDGYVADVASYETSGFPGLTLDNLGCPGETTTTMINGGICKYQDGSQLSQAEDFLNSHRGQVAFVTIDIGANNVDGCIGSSGVNVDCAFQGISTISSQLPQILSGLASAAGSDTPVFGVNYWDSFLGIWLLGSAGQTDANLSLTFLGILNGTLDDLYGSFGDHIVDVGSAFHSNDTAQNETYNGKSVPDDVYFDCEWTWFCTRGDIHPNTTGYSVIAGVVEASISRFISGFGLGAWLASSSGEVIPVGNAPNLASGRRVSFTRPIVAIASTADGGGYWLADQSGGVFCFGDARFNGSAAAIPVSGSVVAIVSTVDSKGYWLVSSQGGVYAFGDAAYLGSAIESAAAGTIIWGSISSAAATPDGLGYWLVSSGGGVYSYGDAPMFGGEVGGTSGPVTSIVSTPDGNGYWLLSSGGGVYAFGESRYLGSPGPDPNGSSQTSSALPETSVSIAASPYQFGYWTVTSNGTINKYGWAQPFDSVVAPLQYGSLVGIVIR
ncbi:MAG TPA: SGNH/GDSL hydrolase family protein [Acidimicrobiales bacterium]|nr:SGNH/GDSL hydrolase family protein [Acidimicrobiales bacterium]